MAISKRLINKILNVNTSYIIASDKKTVTSFIQCIVREDINFFFFWLFFQIFFKVLKQSFIGRYHKTFFLKKNLVTCACDFKNVPYMQAFIYRSIPFRYSY